MKLELKPVLLTKNFIIILHNWNGKYAAACTLVSRTEKTGMASSRDTSKLKKYQVAKVVMKFIYSHGRA